MKNLGKDEVVMYNSQCFFTIHVLKLHDNRIISHVFGGVPVAYRLVG